MNEDELKKLWQSQPNRPRVQIEADILLQEFRRNKQSFVSTVLLGEWLIMAGLVITGVLFIIGGTLAQRELPFNTLWGFYASGLICIAMAGWKGLDRLRQMKRRSSVADPIQACLEENLDWVKHEIRLWSRDVLWWFLVPVSLGELVLLFSIRVALDGLGALYHPRSLFDLLVSAVFIWGGYQFCRWYCRKYYEPRERELNAVLQSLQSS